MATVFKREDDQKKKRSRWKISWFDADQQRWRQSNGYTDKQTSIEKGVRLELEAARKAEGLVDTYTAHRKCPIGDHLDDFLAHIQAGHRDERYILQVQNRIARIIQGTDVKRLHELDPVAVRRFLDGLRIKGRSLSGITLNEYIGCIRSFTSWAIKARRLDVDPLASLERIERRSISKAHPRRALSNSEVARLLGAASKRPFVELKTIRTGKNKGRVLAKLSAAGHARAERIGRDRRLAYLIAVWTGLRRSEIKALQWSDLDLNAGVPHIRLRQETTKSNRADTLVLHPELVVALRDARDSVPKGTQQVVASVPDMKALRADLRFAGIDPGNVKARFVDFHALRMTLSTMMAAAGMTQRLRQAHMRHTDPRLTENTYMDETLLSVASELTSLPELMQESNADEPVQESQKPARNMHETGDLPEQFEASGDNVEVPCNEQIFELALSPEVQEMLGVARDGTKEQGHASSDAWPCSKRVMRLELTTFTLAT